MFCSSFGSKRNSAHRTPRDAGVDFRSRRKVASRPIGRSADGRANRARGSRGHRGRDPGNRDRRSRGGRILGKSVRSKAGEDMGQIIDVIVKRDGQVRAAVIDSAGFSVSVAGRSPWIGAR